MEADAVTFAMTLPGKVEDLLKTEYSDNPSPLQRAMGQKIKEGPGNWDE